MTCVPDRVRPSGLSRPPWASRPHLRSGAVTTQPPKRGRTQRQWAVLAAVVCAAQVLALAGFVVFYLYEIGIGASDDTGRAVMSVVLFVVFGSGLAAMGRAWLRDQAWPRTPTIVWNLLLLPVAWGLRSGDQLAVSLTVGVAAVLAIAAAALAGAPPEPADPTAGTR